MHFQVPHRQTRTEAKQKVKDALEEARPHMKGDVELMKEEWQDNVLHFELRVQGKTIVGTVEVGETDFILDATLPLLWRMFEGRIEKEIEKHVHALK